MRVAIEKLKHVLSANLSANLQIECLTDTLDINFLITREEFETITAHVLERITSPLRIALHEADLKKEDIHFVEIIGGSTRIPAIQVDFFPLFYLFFFFFHQILTNFLLFNLIATTYFIF